MCAYGPSTGGKRGLSPNVSLWISRPAGSPFGSCRIGAGLSSQTAALRPPSSSRRSGASRARRRTPEEPRQTPRSGYRPRRTMGPPRRRIRRVGSYCGNLGPPPQHLVSIKPGPAPTNSARTSATRGAGSPTLTADHVTMRLNLSIQLVDEAKAACQHVLLVLAEIANRGFAQEVKLASHSGLGQLCHGLGVLITRDELFRHGRTRLAQDLTRHRRQLDVPTFEDLPDSINHSRAFL